MRNRHESDVMTIAPFSVKMAILLLLPDIELGCSSWQRLYMSSFIPGTSTAWSLSGPSRPCIVGLIGSPNAPCIVTSAAYSILVIFHWWPTPLIPAPESNIFNDCSCWTDIILIYWACNELIFLFLVGVENLVGCSARLFWIVSTKSDLLGWSLSILINEFVGGGG